MPKNYLKALFVVMFSTLLFSCATQKPLTTFKAHDFSAALRASQYTQKVDNFMVILDSSASMDDPYSYRGPTKLNFAKDIVSRMNQTIPDLKLTGALSTFGGGFCPFSKRTTLVYGPAEYSKAELEKALKTVKWASGKSPLAKTIDVASEDMKSTQGKIAVIIVSDGEDMDDAPVLAAQSMKSVFGDRLCIYTISVRGVPGIMDQIAQAGRCGFSVSADRITSSECMADFVEKVFLAKRSDTDGDGVYDDLDQCPNTPTGVKVDARGCPLDTDGDGVYDYMDDCPNTPRGVRVDKKGCPLDRDGDGVYDYLDQCPGTPKDAKVNERGCWILGGILFATAKWNIKPEVYPALDEIAEVLQKNPTLRVEIQGHTDNIGNEAYNMKLSENRARAVMEYLVRKGIQPQQLSAAGYGFSRPIAYNDTPEGRAKNRRVELKPIY